MAKIIKEKKAPNTGNPEADRLLKEIERLEQVRSDLIEKRDELYAINGKIIAELRITKESLTAALEQVKALKETMNLSQDKGRQNSEDFLEIVYVPPAPGVKVSPKILNGVLYNSIIDENGFHHWIYPAKQAKQILGVHNCNHVLAGPVDTVEVEQKVGYYYEMVTVKRHVCRIFNGQAKWIPVEISESKEE